VSSDAVLTVLAAAAPGTIRWPAAIREAGGFAGLVTTPPAACRRLGLDDAAIAALAKPDAAILDRWRRWLSEPGHALISLACDAYPAQLAALDDPPLALWMRGAEPALLAAPQIAIVGSRQATAGGRELARSFAAALGEAGITVASGLAAGIDAAAHTGAVDTPGGTVAVLGCGADLVYPRRHAALAARIAGKGAIVSEYPPGSPPRAYRFPERNRIIAGLALGTLVVEAATRSGSLITARLAGAYGREVFAVPGSVLSSFSRGCHRLLRDGACLVETIDDIVSEIAPALSAALTSRGGPAPPQDPSTDGGDAAKLLKHLEFSPTTIDVLARACGLTTKDVSSMLLQLELEGTVEALPGGRYCRLIKRSR
jgi:DNA processing protein